MIKKRLFCIGLSFLMVLTFVSGCAKETSDEEIIELVEPVGVTANYVKAERRDLTSYKVYSGRVVPTVYETSFVGGQNFEKYGSLLGSEVKKGDAIVYASTKSIDDQIKTLKEKMQNATESYNERMKDLNKTLENAVLKEKEFKVYVDNLDRMDDTTGQPVTWIRGTYSSAIAARMRAETDIEKETKAFEIERNYDNLCLKRLNEDRRKVVASAPADGTVVATWFPTGDSYWVNKGTSVGAVGDFSKLVVKCDFILKSEIKRAVEYYAVSNGVRYNAVYIEPETDTAPTTGATDVTAYSTFVLDDPEGNIKAGDFVAIVLINKVVDDALCIPAESVSTDSDGSYVYVFDGEKTSYRQIKTGMRNGLYTEVTSGLEEGETIVSEFKVKERSTTTTLEKGKVCVSFKGTGYVFYPKVESITNTNEYGTTYIKELAVKRYQQVKKGDILAYIYVTPDSIGMERLERKIQRANEDLEDTLKAAEEDNDADKYEKSIKLQRESIDEMHKELNQMKKEARTTTVAAPYDGLITEIGWFNEGDILQKDAFICSLAEEKDCFIYVEDNNGQLTVGNEVNVSFDDYTCIGQVVSVAPCALTNGLNIGYSFIQVSPEDFAKIATPSNDLEGYWFRRSFDITADVRSMDNVVIVPKRAVTVDNGVTYVTVLDENNNYVLKSFTAGGGDNLNYWAAEGLTEGTVICLE